MPGLCSPLKPIVCARGLLPADNELYARAYSAGQLHDELRAAADASSEEELETSNAAWLRLLGLFTAGRITLAEWVAVWEPGHLAGEAKMAAYRSHLRNHILPVFGDAP